MLFVRLHVLTELHCAVSVEVKLVVMYDFRWAFSFGDSTLQGKHVTPEHGYICHLYYCDMRQVVKRDPDFGGTVISLDLWNMLVLRCDVKLGM